MFLGKKREEATNPIILGQGMLQNNGMLSRQQLLRLFSRFSFLVSLPDAKKRISDAVQDQQEAVALTTAIQEEIFLEMGIVVLNPWKNREETACDKAQLGPDEYSERVCSQEKLQEQIVIFKQLEMLKHVHKFALYNQSAILDKLHQQMESANFEFRALLLSSQHIQEIVRRRVSPLYEPR